MAQLVGVSVVSADTRNTIPTWATRAVGEDLTYDGSEVDDPEGLSTSCHRAWRLALPWHVRGGTSVHAQG